MFHYYSLYRKYPILIKRRLSADLLNQVFFKVADKPQFLDYLCYKENKSISTKQARVLAHKAPSKLQGGNPPFPSTSTDLRRTITPCLNSRLHVASLEHEYSSA